MKIRTLLTLLFTVITAGILFLFAAYIYYSAAGDRQELFYQQLRKEAMTRANVLFDAGVDPAALQTIYLQNREMLSEVEVAIYDTGFNLLYHDAEDIDFVKETPEMIARIVEEGEIRFTQEGWEVIGILFGFEGSDYVITAAAYDEYGHNSLTGLLRSLLIACIVSVVAIYLAGMYFSKRALRPVSRMAEKAGEISASNLHLRLSEGKANDELAELATTFNRMLDRLENSFDAQREFVSNIAHELRTPLSAIIGEAELALTKNDISNASRVAFTKIVEDARRLSRLGTGLMDMAKASYEAHQLSFKDIRLDELIMEARQEVLRIKPDHRIEIIIDESLDDETMLTIRGNPYLLKVACTNILENACKFSGDNTAIASITFNAASKKVEISVKDNGPGIPEADLTRVFKPFYRASNVGSNAGSGIGLSLTQRIMRLHNADIVIDSTPGSGTTVYLRFGLAGVS